MPRDGLRIGHLDTGVDASHPALAGRVARFRVFDPGGYSFHDAPAHDSGWHGTATASLMVASGAVLSSGVVIEDGAIIARILLGLDWLAGLDVPVVNLSLGVAGVTPVFRTLVRVLCERDVLVVAPVGNDGAGDARSPGVYPEVLSVGSTGADGRVARFSGSSYDARTATCIKPDVVAPGVDRLAAEPGNGWRMRSGTSMSAALVAGMAARLRKAFPAVPAVAVRRALCASSAMLAPDQTLRSRYGEICLEAASEYLRAGKGEGVETSAVLSSPCPYADRRLTAQLSHRGALEHQDAVLEFSGQVALEAFCSQVADDGLCRVTRLHHAPIVIVRCPAGLINEALQSAQLCCASACDVDRSAYLGGRARGR
jgi:subtilisin family serine protease